MQKIKRLLFSSKFDPWFPLDIAKIEERQSREKIQPSTIQIFHSRGPFFSPLITENKITCLKFPAFLDKKNKVWSKVAGSKSKSDTAFHWAVNCGLLKTQKVWPTTFSFCGLWSQRAFQKYLNTNFQVWMLFLVLHLHFRKI